MNIERSLKERDRLTDRLSSLYATCITYGHSHETFLVRRGQVYAVLAKGTPDWVVQYGKGYEKARDEELYRDHLVFGGLIDGVFYGTHRDRADYYEKHGFGPSVYADDGLVKRRGHYWRGEANRPYSTKKEGT